MSTQRRHACDFCDLRFKDATGLKIHRNSKHTHEETHVCDHCAAVFYTKYKLDTHLASKHGINDGFKCVKCKRFLKNEFTLLKHTRKCSFTPCPVCGKEFMSKWKLGNHVKGHMDTKSHICDECGKDFLHDFTLVEHIEVVHQGKRPYTCTRCEKTFSRAGNLRAHKLIHTGVRPFPCKLCDKECREKIQLIKHLRSKHSIEDSQMHNFVKLVPKKQIVQNEDMKNLLQNITSVKREPIIEEPLPFIVKPVNLKTEPLDQEAEHSEKQSYAIRGSIPYETHPDESKVTKNISSSWDENMTNIAMKSVGEEINKQKEDPDMVDESNFIKELEDDFNNLIKEFEDKELKKEVVEMKANEGKKLKEDIKRMEAVEKKEMKEKVNNTKEIIDMEKEQDIDLDENLDEFKFERIEF